MNKGKGKEAPVIDDYTKGGGGGDKPLDGGSSISKLIGADPWNVCGTAGQQQGVTSTVKQMSNLDSKGMTTPVNKGVARYAVIKADPKLYAAKKKYDKDRYLLNRENPKWLEAKSKREKARNEAIKANPELYKALKEKKSELDKARYKAKKRKLGPG